MESGYISKNISRLTRLSESRMPNKEQPSQKFDMFLVRSVANRPRAQPNGDKFYVVVAERLGRRTSDSR